MNDVTLRQIAQPLLTIGLAARSGHRTTCGDPPM